MKKLILLLFTLSIYQIGFSQVDLNIDKSLTIEEEVDENYTPFNYISNGVYEITFVGDYKFDKIVEQRKNKLREFIKRNNYSYEIINESTEDVGRSPYNQRWELIFRLKDSSGTLIITKKEAKKQLLDLKELLDLGLITQTEYDNKAQGLKKVLLN